MKKECCALLGEIKKCGSKAAFSKTHKLQISEQGGIAQQTQSTIFTGAPALSFL
jgi:hypothetical protein